MPRKAKVATFALFVFSLISIVSAEEFSPFSGQVNAENINLRSDATTGAEVISKLSTGERLDVVAAHYDWYKVKLPKSVPVYLRKDLVSVLEDKVSSIQPTAPQLSENAKVIKSSINIRRLPNDSSGILGKASFGEIVKISSDEGQWYKIEPTENCFAWVHKKFVSQAQVKEPDSTLAQATETETQKTLIVQGVIRPYGMVFHRRATHKLVSGDKVYLLTGDRKTLNQLNQRKVKVTGKLVSEPQTKTPLLEVEKLEVVE